MEVAFSSEAAIHWLKGFEKWAWLAAIGLLFLDFILPVPGTAVMSALGYVYGPILGGLIASGGSILAGWFAYGLCRLLGKQAAIRLLGQQDYARGVSLFFKRRRMDCSHFPLAPSYPRNRRLYGRSDTHAASQIHNRSGLRLDPTRIRLRLHRLHRGR